MKTLYFDLIGGASGDMILGSLVDAGVPLETLKELLKGLNLDEFDLLSKTVDKNGFKATHLEVTVNKQPPERHLKEIEEIIKMAEIPAKIKTEAIEIFNKIASVEAGIHNLPIEQVHLHELGGTDTIVDVVGTLMALEYLNIENINSSAVPLGKGFVKGAHGNIPLPAPATIALLEGVPVFGRDIEAELVTPTGAALLSNLVEDFGPPPNMVIQSIGYGAGSRDLPIPNLLRIFIGEVQESEGGNKEHLMVIETNIDDQNPEIYPYLSDLLFDAGALDVILIPVQMKKNRPGTQIQILSEISDTERLKSIVFTETTTLGVKQYPVERFSLSRKFEEINTPYGKVRIKIATIAEDKLKVSPEFEDCAQLARKHQVPVQKIYQAAIELYNKSRQSS
jgi:uncharacterized protein (TIGR00299 family) protein